MNSKQKATVPKMRAKQVEGSPYVVDHRRLGHFSIKNIVFQRVASDPSWKCYRRKYNENVPRIVEKGKPGYSRVDFALSYASWTVHDAFEGGFSRTKIKPYRTSLVAAEIDWAKTRYRVDDPRQMSAWVKRAARLFGASLTGVCKLNRDWLYQEDDVPERFENAIAMAVEMDPDGIATSSAAPAGAATGTGYSRMAFVLACMGEFIRNLGYEAIQCGNGIALSVPIAIDAGLGELGRNGLLITPQYGPRVRLCKIFTDLPLEADRSIEFGVKRFCRKCKLCAKTCETGAISKADEPSFEVACRSNNPGALKWYVNAELCYQFWCENGMDCSACISVCPYNIASAGKVGVDPEEFWKTK